MWQLLGVLVICGLVLHYVWWILAAAVVWYLIKGAREASAAREAKTAAVKREQEAIASRADQQHRWALAGDDRGVYGTAAQAVQNYQRATG